MNWFTESETLEHWRILFLITSTLIPMTVYMVLSIKWRGLCYEQRDLIVSLRHRLDVEMQFSRSLLNGPPIGPRHFASSSTGAIGPDLEIPRVH